MAPIHALTLDLGSGHRRLYEHVFTADIARDEMLDYRLDAHVLPFSDDTFDRVVMQEVLEHVTHPREVLREVARVMKAGGLLYLEVPFLYPVHDRADFRRWSVTGLQAELSHMDVLESGVTVGVVSAVSVAIRTAATHWISNSYAAWLVDIVVGWCLWPFRFLDDVIAKRPEAQICAGAIYVVARKPSGETP